MNNNVAVIGCGQLGRRHIQGLGLSSSQINVHVYDVAKASLKTCATFAEEIADNISNLHLSYFDDIKTLGEAVSSFDLVIISSTATARPSQIKSLKSFIQSKAWLLEKPICQSPDELDELLDLTKDMTVWVNHYRRVVPWYQALKTEYFAGQKMNITFAGTDIGIGCNISHLIDLVNFMTGAIPVSADASGLSDKWHDAKRQGFKEIDGEMTLQFSDGSTTRIVSQNELSDLKITGDFPLTGKTFVIEEAKGIVSYNGELIEVGQMPFQSQLTGKLFDQIKQQGVSDLTPLPVAADCYRVAISSLLDHWQSTPEGKDDQEVPLT